MEKLTSPKVIDTLLKKYDLHFNKRYGQNFLIDENIVERIASAGNLTKDDTVLEIGPGIGTLTQALAHKASRVISVEIDKKLLPVLAETLADYDNVTVIQGDILKTDLSPYLPTDKPFKIVANLPYYITTPIIMKFLEEDWPVDTMTFLIQKEVGERLCAEPGTKAYGSLTIAAQFYAELSTDFYVSAGVFMPKPKVDSIVVTLTRRQTPAHNLSDKALFFKVVRAAFLNRRKTLINSLSANLNFSKDALLAALSVCEIEPNIRGEKLTGADFARLANQLAML